MLNFLTATSHLLGFDVGEISEDAPDDLEGLDASAAHVANLLSTEPEDSTVLLQCFCPICVFLSNICSFYLALFFLKQEIHSVNAMFYDIKLDLMLGCHKVNNCTLA